MISAIAAERTANDFLIRDMKPSAQRLMTPAVDPAAIRRFVVHAGFSTATSDTTTAAKQTQSTDAEQTECCWFGDSRYRGTGKMPDRQSAPEAAAGGRDLVKSVVDERIVRAVHDAVVVEIAVRPSGEMCREANVNLCIVGPIDGSVQVGIAIKCVLNQHIARSSWRHRRTYRRCFACSRSSSDAGCHWPRRWT